MRSVLQRIGAARPVRGTATDGMARARLLLSRNARPEWTVPELESIRKHLHDETPRIVRWLLDCWTSICTTEPWLVLPPDLDQDHLPQVVRDLADAALADGDSDDARRRLAWAAVEHGGQRRRCGFAENLIHTEYYLLRRTLWTYLREQFPATPGTVEAILRIDAAITLASSASLLGYHRDALERAGRWPDGVQKVLDDHELRQ
jgi:hypothetical protein